MSPANIEYAYSRRSKYTFRCKRIREWANRFVGGVGEVWVDPFAGQTPFLIQHKNDIADSGVDSHDWILQFKDESVDGVFFDPPYSLERIKRSYEGSGLKEWQKAHRNQSGTFPKLKDEIARIVKPGGVVLSFGWSSAGLGSGRGFKKEDILLVFHSGAARDTICVAERKK